MRGVVFCLLILRRCKRTSLGGGTTYQEELLREVYRYGIGFVLGAACTFGAVGLWDRPSTFDECMLANSRGAQGEAGLLVVAHACREKFPAAVENHAEDAYINDPLIRLGIDGRAGLRQGNLFGGTLYNSYDSLTITQVDIQVSAITSRDTVNRIYRHLITIRPRSTADFEFGIVLADSNYYGRPRYEWHVVAAKGHRAN